MTDLTTTIAELRSLLAAATPGEWRTAPCCTNPDHDAERWGLRLYGPTMADRFWDGGDVALIAVAHNALPALLDAAERCEAAEARRVVLEDEMAWFSNERQRANAAEHQRDKAVAALRALVAPTANVRIDHHSLCASRNIDGQIRACDCGLVEALRAAEAVLADAALGTGEKEIDT